MGSRRSAARAAAAAAAMLLRSLHNPEETPSSGRCVWVFSLTVCGLLCFISFMYLYTLYTVLMFRFKTVERADQIGVGFLRRTKNTYEYLKHSADRVTDTKRSLIT